MAKTIKSRTAKRPSPRSRQTLKGRMADIRQALTSLGVRNGQEDLFFSTLEQLDALGDEIAAATDRMMTATESIQDAANTIGAKS